jgi:sucrose-6-phosphate hydrolase SacC (GH32 family)
MPPANWTNEPHGLVRVGEDWHLFYQRTPNGPFKTQMHWGHMVSTDLVTWTHLPDALRPELQSDDFGFDQKGIWSGDVIYDGGVAFAFYTSVNHSHRLASFNPGISIAMSEDPQLIEWKKLGPIINTEHVVDFRDPYLWREDNTWHMIIGAALDSGGGLDYYILEAADGAGKWRHRKRFSALSYRVLDIGSLIWEMPVFEKLADGTRVLVVNPIAGKVTKYGDPATRGMYWTGEWKDGLFHPHYKKAKLLDVIPGHLSPTVARGDDGRLRAIGIVDERRIPQAQEDAGWAHTFSFPRVWSLLPDGRTLRQAPAPELSALRGTLQEPKLTAAIGNAGLTLASGEHAYEVELALDGDDAIGLDLMLSPDGRERTRITVDPAKGVVVLDKSQSSLRKDGEGPDILDGHYDATAHGTLELIRVFVDGSIVEVFFNDSAAFSFRAYPSLPESTGLRVFAPGGTAALSAAKIWPLRQAD